MSELSFPSSPSAGTRYIAPIGIAYFFDGYTWCSDGLSINPNPYNDAFKYRTIYTRGYVHCGYANGSPWRNTNRTLHMVDTTANLGDMMDNIASYIDGGFSDYNTYVFNVSGSVGGTSATVSSMSMITETLRTYSNTRDLKTARADCKTLMNPGLTAIYITGGNSSSTDKLSTVTDTMLASGSAAANGQTGGGTSGGLSGMWGKYKGLIGANSASAFLDWTTETWSAANWPLSTSTDGQPKGLSSKWGWGYNSDGSYAGTNTYYKINDTTGAQISSFSRPDNAGEENCQIGQDWGYTLGQYNGYAGQNNNTAKTYYTSDSSVALGAAGQPKGHGGMSSAASGTGSVTFLGGVMGTSI
jgi:hypothetical protein